MTRRSWTSGFRTSRDFGCAPALAQRGSQLPVLILSGRSGWAERVNGLNAGADDYLEKPFQAQELVARLRSLLRRSSGQSETMRRRRDIEIDAAAGTVTKNGVPVELTALELRILDLLMRHSDRIVSQKELLEHSTLSTMAAKLKRGGGLRRPASQEAGARDDPHDPGHGLPDRMSACCAGISAPE